MIDPRLGAIVGVLPFRPGELLIEGDGVAAGKKGQESNVSSPIEDVKAYRIFMSQGISSLVYRHTVMATIRSQFLVLRSYLSKLSWSSKTWIIAMY